MDPLDPRGLNIYNILGGPDPLNPPVDTPVVLMNYDGKMWIVMLLCVAHTDEIIQLKVHITWTCSHIELKTLTYECSV